MGKLYLVLGIALGVTGVLILTNVIDLIAIFTPGGTPACVGSECDAGRGGVWTAGGVLVVLGVVFTAMGWFFKSAGDEYKRLKSTGIAGSAFIRGVHRTSVYVNDQPMATLDLEVEADGVKSSVSQSVVVPLLYLSRVIPGGTLPVLVDPRNATNVMIDWDAPGMTQAPA